MLLCCIAMTLGAVVYLGALDGPFVYDDRLTVLGNPSIHDLGSPAAIVLHDVFRPVVNLSYALDHALWGMDPFGYHVTNLLLHLVNVMLLFVTARCLARDRDDRNGMAGDDHRSSNATAFTAASLFAVHPLMTEAVGYVSGRSELLVTGLLLIGVLLFRDTLVSRRRLSCFGGAVVFVLGVASKETAAMLPFLLITADVLVLDGDADSRRSRLLRFHLPFAALVVAAGLARVAVYARVERGGELLTLWQHALTEVGVVWRYVGLMLLPVGQSIMHPVETVTRLADPMAWIAVVALVAAAAALVPLARHQPLIGLGLTWFLLLLAPAHVIPLQEAMAEHRIYTASCGFFIGVGAVAGLLARRLGPRPITMTLAVILVPLLLVLSAATVRRTEVWADEVSLWEDAARKAPRTWGAQYAWGDALRTAGRCADAEPAYRRAIELIPGEVSAHLNLGICLAELGRFDEAWQSLARARSIDPTNPKPLTNLGTLAARMGRFEEARESFRTAIELDADSITARLLLAQLSEAAFDDPSTALELCREVLVLAPRTRGVRDCIERNQARVADQ